MYAGVYHYAYDPAERPGADVHDERGVASTDGTCSFTGEGTGDSTTVTVVDEVTFDPATCTRELSIAVYDADAVPAAVQEDLGTAGRCRACAGTGIIGGRRCDAPGIMDSEALRMGG